MRDVKIDIGDMDAVKEVVEETRRFPILRPCILDYRAVCKSTSKRIKLSVEEIVGFDVLSQVVRIITSSYRPNLNLPDRLMFPSWRCPAGRL